MLLEVHNHNMQQITQTTSSRIPTSVPRFHDEVGWQTDSPQVSEATQTYLPPKGSSVHTQLAWGTLRDKQSLLLSVMHNNEHAECNKATTSTGQLVYKVAFLKSKKNRHNIL